jgi:hypothetical protein
MLGANTIRKVESFERENITHSIPFDQGIRASERDAIGPKALTSRVCSRIAARPNVVVRDCGIRAIIRCCATFSDMEATPTSWVS